MAINFNQDNADKAIAELKSIKTMNEEINIRKISGNGSGQCADEIMELTNVVDGMRTMLTNLIQSTIDFLTGYSEKIQKTN